MPRTARLSDHAHFSIGGGVDLDEVAERVQQRDEDIEAAGFDRHDDESVSRNVRRIPAYASRFG